MKNQELVLDSYKKGAKSGGEFCTRLLEELSGVFWEELQKTLENGEFKKMEMSSKQAAEVSPDGLLVTGYLAGRLGRNHVLVLTDSKAKLPAAAGFLRTVPLKESAKWKSEIKSDASKL